MTSNLHRSRWGDCTASGIDRLVVICSPHSSPHSRPLGHDVAATKEITALGTARARDDHLRKRPGGIAIKASVAVAQRQVQTCIRFVCVCVFEVTNSAVPFLATFVD